MRTSSVRRLCTGAVALVLVLLPAAAATAQPSTGPGPIPPRSSAFGQPAGDWSADWWRWAAAQGVAPNAITDPSGADCATGQSGRVWFLAGTAGGFEERTCTVPVGTAILVPVINAAWSAAEEAAVGGCPLARDVPPGASLEQRLAGCAAALMDHVTELSLTVDGRTVPHLERYRTSSEPFAMVAHPQNAFGIPAGATTAVSDGYWVLLPPLPVGTHEVRFSAVAVFPEFGTEEEPFVFEVGVTYQIEVVAGRPRTPPR